jgi:3-mercaptopyruvate sulfurtransferase SseA
MVDVRSPQEFSGEILAPPGLPETCQRSWTEWGNLVGAPVEKGAVAAAKG